MLGKKNSHIQKEHICIHRKQPQQTTVRMKGGRGRWGQGGGADRTETDSGTIDLWPYFSQESRLALSLLSTMATSPHYVLPCGPVVCPWQVKKPKKGEAESFLWEEG